MACIKIWGGLTDEELTSRSPNIGESPRKGEKPCNNRSSHDQLRGREPRVRMPTSSDVVRGFLEKSGLFLLRHPGPVGHGVKRDIVMLLSGKSLGAYARAGVLRCRPESEKSWSGNPERSGETILFLLSTIHYPLSAQKQACVQTCFKRKRKKPSLLKHWNKFY